MLQMLLKGNVEMPELRKDPVIGRWVIIATERARRPGTFLASSGFLPMIVNLVRFAIIMTLSSIPFPTIRGRKFPGALKSRRAEHRYCRPAGNSSGAAMAFMM